MGAAAPPTLEGFANFVSGIMGVPGNVLPSDAVSLQVAYDYAIDIVISSALSGGGLDLVPSQSSDSAPNPNPPPTAYRTPSIYALAVYFLAGDMLVRIAQDATDPAASPPPDNAPTYWADLRKSFGVNAMTYGLVQSSSDQGTSMSYAIPEQVKNMTLANLMQMQTPWGRQYLAIAGQWGPTLWGMS
jgi:hypothetical protein